MDAETVKIALAIVAAVTGTFMQFQSRRIEDPLRRESQMTRGMLMAIIALLVLK